MKDPAGTRNKIIQAAEDLFAEGGEEATTVRSVTQAAGVNVAAIQYHFGGRDGLLRAVLDRLVEPINARRLELLDTAQAEHGDDVPVAAVLAAFLRPDLELLAALRRDRAPLARFLGRAYVQPSPVVAQFADGQFAPVAARMLSLLAHALPDLDPDELEFRLRLIISIVTTLFATLPDPDQPGRFGTDDIETQLARLLAFCVPGLTGPALPAPPTKVQRRR